MRRARVEETAGAPERAVVHAGGFMARVPCARDPEGDTLGLPPDFLEAAGLVPGQEVHLLEQDDGQHVYVGPLVGVWLGSRGIDLLRGGAERYRRVAREARAAGTVPFFFAIEGVDRGAGRITGWVERGGGWAQARLPLPDVIYNRTTYGDAAQREHAAALRRQLTALEGVVLLNGVNSFTKWDTCAALQFHADTAALAPETIRVSHMAGVMDMLDRLGRVFLKRNDGSHGSDVTQISADPCWSVQGKVGGGRVHESFASRDQLEAFVAILTHGADWVVQQGVDLPRVGGRFFDLRAIAQKDGRGDWQVPLVLVRWAQPDRVAANMSQGASPFLPADFLARHGGELAPELAGMEAAATECTLLVVQALESRYGLLGEVGVDIGMDRSGRPWVFEANAKPLHPEADGLPAALDDLPFRYAVYLAQRKWTGRHTGLTWPAPAG